MLDKLWISTQALHERFRGEPPTRAAAVHAFKEEVREVLGEDRPVELAQECVDVLVTMVGIMLSEGVTLEQFSAAVDQVCRKNDAKTHETHRVNEAGKIQRIGR